MAAIKAIETRYKGYRFRSRLEARWAVFFDALGIEYQYEPEGYELPSGTLYLPDFYLPQLHLWVEVKPEVPDSDGPEWDKISAVAGERDELCTIVGQIPTPGAIGTVVLAPGLHLIGGFVGGNEGLYVVSGSYWDFPYQWCVCPSCGKAGFQFEARSDRLSCKESFDGTQPGCPRISGNRDRGHTGDHPLILAAFEKARSARFEHGETP